MAGGALAIIPARGGSKRIPRKNLKPFRGRPIIAWSIEAAQASGQFDEVMVSTDDQEIAETAQAHGATVPFLRSDETSDDHAPVQAVLREVLARYGADGRSFHAACCIYATAPLIRPDDLSAGRAELEAGGFDVVVSVCAFDAPIWRSFARDRAGALHWNYPQHSLARSQDLPEAYHDAGQWVWFKVESFLQRDVLLDGEMGAFVLPRRQVQDIDTDEDWVMCEMKHQFLFG